MFPWNANAVDYSKTDVVHTELPVSSSCVSSANDASGRKSSVENRSKFIDLLESKINPDTLVQFKETNSKTTPVWMGAESSHDLYVVWKRAYDSSLQTPLPETITETEPPFLPHTPKPAPSNANVSSTESVVQLTKTSDATSSIVINPAVPSTSAASDREQKMLKALSRKTQGNGVKSPFKKHLFWPGTPEKKLTKETRSNCLVCCHQKSI